MRLPLSVLAAAPLALCAAVHAQPIALPGAPPPDSPMGKLIAAIPKEKGCYAFAYVEPDLDGSAVRLEALMPLAAVDRLVDVVPGGAEMLTWDERQVIRPIISDYLAPFNVVAVNGQPLALERAEVDFFDTTNMWMPVLRDVRPDNLMVAFIGIYRAPAAVDEVRLEWNLFADPPEPVQLVATICSAEPRFEKLAPEARTFAWTEGCSKKEPRALADMKVAADIAAGFPASLTDAKPRAEEIVRGLLLNAYLAFEQHEEAAVREVLAATLDGALVEPIFKDIRTSLEDRQALGAVPRVESMSLNFGDLIGAETTAAGVRQFKYRCAWKANGMVSHWGHGHKRGIGREAILTVAERGGAWHIAAIEEFRTEAVNR